MPYSLAVLQNDVSEHPINEMIFETSFDDLMQEVACHQFVDIGMREVIAERL